MGHEHICIPGLGLHADACNVLCEFEYNSQTSRFANVCIPIAEIRITYSRQIQVRGERRPPRTSQRDPYTSYWNSK